MVARPAASARRMPITVTVTVTATSASHNAGDEMPSRLSTPSSDWFPAYHALPTRLSSNARPVQYFRESLPAHRKPIPVVTTKDSRAVSAARRSRRSSRYSTNTAGVSLIAAATPISSPRGQRGRLTRMSGTTSAITSTSIWPA